jgi:hypothetical protein
MSNIVRNLPNSGAISYLFAWFKFTLIVIQNASLRETKNIPNLTMLGWIPVDDPMPPKLKIGVPSPYYLLICTLDTQL